MTAKGHSQDSRMWMPNPTRGTREDLLLAKRMKRAEKETVIDWQMAQAKVSLDSPE